MPEIPQTAPSAPPTEASTDEKPASKRRPYRWSWPLLVFLTILLAILLPARSSLGDWNDVPSVSMEPNIFTGDRIWINKLAYDLKFPFTKWQLARWADPQRGDIVVFYSPQDGTRMVKRIIGLPGDEIAMMRNKVFINQKRLEYTPLFHNQLHRFAVEHRPDHQSVIMVTPRARARKRFPPVQVPEGHYLILGDNRDLSADYRTFGFVPRADIEGRATSVVMSFDTDNGWSPRWERFFTELP
ncbi:MAG: signal peptidase I [Limisphaerales bacterium]